MKSQRERARVGSRKSVAPDPRPVTNNRLLKAMSDSDLALLTPHLLQLSLPVRTDLERPNIPFRTAYFIDHGIASVVAISDRNTQIEVGLIGCEGVSGLAVIMGSDRSPNHTYMQIGGSGFSIATDDLNAAIDQSPTLRMLLLRYAQAFGIQTTHAAVANAKANVESRLARWILMAYDRVPASSISLTHEFLALMLGVRRPGVTESLRALTKRGLIESPKNGLIVLVDRDGLRKVAGPFYGIPEREYKRLIR
ncbi:MAG TPA: Crp/Fnr family transcriptional regulator [Rhizomicrobium sp.]|jgi:CRP-like cAMP-binding protein